MQGSATTGTVGDSNQAILDDEELHDEEDDEGAPTCASCQALARIVSEYDLLCRGLVGALEGRARGAETRELAPIRERAVEVQDASGDDQGRSTSRAGSRRRLVVLSDSPDVLFHLEPLPSRRRSLTPARSRPR
jgi:hypothetical protein